MLHEVGDSCDLYYDARKHKIKTLMLINIISIIDIIYDIILLLLLSVKVNQPHYSPGVAQRVPGS